MEENKEYIGELYKLFPDMLNGDFELNELIESIKNLKDRFPQYSNFYFEDIGCDEVIYTLYGIKNT
jgi:hypothetical protein